MASFGMYLIGRLLALCSNFSASGFRLRPAPTRAPPFAIEFVLPSLISLFCFEFRVFRIEKTRFL
jgi:hypothetical protein